MNICESCKIDKKSAVYELYIEEIAIINKLNIPEDIINNYIISYLYHCNGHNIHYNQRHLFSNNKRYNICTTCFQSGIFKLLELDKRLPYDNESLYVFNKVGMVKDDILYKNTGMLKYTNLRNSYQIHHHRNHELIMETGGVYERDNDYMNNLKTYFKKYNFPNIYILQKYRQTRPSYINGFFYIWERANYNFHGFNEK